MKRSWTRLGVVVLLCIGLIFCFLTELREDPQFVIPSAAVLAALIAVLGAVVPWLSFRALGAGICLLPLLGSGALSLFVTSWLLGLECGVFATRLDTRSGKKTPGDKLLALGVLSFLLALLVGIIVALFAENDPLVLSAIFEAGGWEDFARYVFSRVYPPNRAILLSAGHLSSFLFLISLVAYGQERQHFADLMLGLCIGVFLSTAVFFLQYFEIHPVFLLNQSEFWRMVDRRSASFSDPNAFGLAAALVIPLLLFCAGGGRRVVFWAASIILLLITSWSGSRTFWLAALLWLITVISRRAGHLFQVRKRFSAAAIAGAIVLLLIIAGDPPINRAIVECLPLPGLVRAVRTINWEESTSMLFSRQVYSRIALQMWRGSPLIGVGLGRFYAEQDRIAESMSIDLSSWRDNANNYYLHVLAEQGVCGFLLVLFSFFLFQQVLAGPPAGSHADASRAGLASTPCLAWFARASLGIFLLLLLTGPHLFFEEVRYLVMIILAIGAASTARPDSAWIFRCRNILLITAGVLPVLLMCVFAYSWRSQPVLGTYALEHSEQDGHFVWTAKTAYFQLCNPGNAFTVLEMRSGNPDIADRPLNVRVVSSYGSSKKNTNHVLLADNAWRRIAVAYPAGSEKNGRARVRIEVPRLWKPGAGVVHGDQRWLGVMVKRPADICGEHD